MIQAGMSENSLKLKSMEHGARSNLKQGKYSVNPLINPPIQRKQISGGTKSTRNILKLFMVYVSGMSKMKVLILPFLFMSICIGVSAQTAAQYEANYAKRIQMEVINGVYIPVDLEDAFAELNRLSDPAGLANFKNAPETSISQSHFGLQQWVQLNWGLEEGSRLSHYLKSKGFSFPDDMAWIIVLTYHRHLNGKPLMFEAEAAEVAKRIKAEQARRDSMRVKISLGTRPHKD